MTAAGSGPPDDPPQGGADSLASQVLADLPLPLERCTNPFLQIQ